MTTLTPVPDISVEPFHLISGHTGEEAEAVIPLMWCVQPATREKYIQDRIADPQFLIVVIHDAGERFEAARYTEMDRYIVPLSAGLEYIRFRRPGKNIVKATIIEDGISARRTRKDFKAKDTDGDYKRPLIDSDGNLSGDGSTRISGGGYARHPHTTQMTFTVSADSFAKPSSPFEKAYFAKFTHKPVDECARRGRRLGLWPLFPIFIVWTSLLKILSVGFQLLIGVRGWNIRPLFHPISNSIADTADDDAWDYGLFWFYKKPIKDGHRSRIGDPRSPFLWPFNPLTVLSGWAIIAFLAAIGWHHGKHPKVLHLFHLAWWQSLSWSIGIHIGLVIFALVLLVIGSGFVWIFEKFFPTSKFVGFLENWGDAWEARKTERTNRKIEALDTDLATMSCEQIPEVVDLSALPKSRQSWHLRIQKTKKAVCRPFAQ